jgi:threonine synthase
MKFISTRGQTAPTSIEAALAAGLASDGGLYVPETIPAADLQTPALSLATMAERVLAPYVAASRLQDTLPKLCAEAYSFDAPLRPLTGDGDHVLELFHGPTAAFKDYAARFLAAALSELCDTDASKPITILVATSGDTGAAVASAFHRRDGFRVEILYPDGMVSPRQAHGLGCWGDNVRAWRVAGSFDDCQRMAKQLLADAALRERVPLTSANSISLGRLLPQAAYYAHAAALHCAAHGRPLGFVIPSGNLGNACAALLAQRMGAPVHALHLATNANDALPRFLEGADYAPVDTIATLANAMDVGAPSNFERLRHWFASDTSLREAIGATRVDDATIRYTIAQAPQRHGIVPCPHTATALHALERLRSAGDTRDWAVVATAHPAKFEGIVEPLVGHAVALPDALAACLQRPAHAEALPADADALRERLLA